MQKQLEIISQLKSMSEDNYKKFNRKIIPTNQEVMGVRLPILRNIAKNIAKNNPMQFIKADKDNIYEMILLEGIVLSYLEESFIKLLPLIENFLDKVDNWAQVDSCIADFKSIKKEKNKVLKIVKKWIKSKKEFVVRAGVVMLLSHYVEKKYLKDIFQLSQKIKHQGYYVHMANAWLISACMAKFPQETIEFLKNNTLDYKTHNKGIQKSNESFRVSAENKLIIKQLKKYKPKEK